MATDNSPALTTVGPIRPQATRCVVEFDDDQLFVRGRPRNWGMGLFMLFWLIGWTAGCVMLAAQAIQERSLFMLLFGIPFWVSWIAVAGGLLYIFFGVEELLVNRQGAIHKLIVLVPVRTRVVPLEEIKAFQTYRSSTEVNDHALLGLEMCTQGKWVRGFQGLDKEELDWLAWELNRGLARLQGPEHERASQPNAALQSAPAAGEPARLPIAPGSSVTLMLGDELPQAPLETDWTAEDLYGAIVFSRRGRFSPLGFLGILFICLFWNGIVSVFVAGLLGLAPNNAQPQGGEWWFMLVFLIPFEFIGLCLLLAVVGVVMEPFHRVTWSVSQQELSLRHAWLGAGWTRRWPIEGLARVDVRRNAARDEHSTQDVSIDDDAGACRLSLVNRENHEVCSLKGLTEAEARWIGQTLLLERADWFRA